LFSRPKPRSEAAPKSFFSRSCAGDAEKIRERKVRDRDAVILQPFAPGVLVRRAGRRITSEGPRRISSSQACVKAKGPVSSVAMNSPVEHSMAARPTPPASVASARRKLQRLDGRSVSSWSVPAVHDADDLALDEPFGEGRVLELVGDGHAQARLQKLGDVRLPRNGPGRRTWGRPGGA